MIKPTEVDWAQLAAYIDGEGTIVITNKSRTTSMHLRVGIRNTDHRLVTWLKERFGGSQTNQAKVASPNHRLNSNWEVSNNDAERVLRGCLPHFIIKREQADTALEFQATINRRLGKKPVPEEVIEKRLQLKERIRALKKVSLPFDIPWTYRITSDDLMIN